MAIKVDTSLALDAPALRAARERVTSGYLRAGKQAVTDTGREAERALEAVTRQAVGGNLWRAWNTRVYPQGGRLAAEPVAVIYPKGAEGGRTQGAIRGVFEGGRITRHGGGYLAIPLPIVGRRGWSGGRGAWVNMSPAEWEKRTGQKLRFVPRPDGTALLVADGQVNGQGRFRRATGRQIDRQTHATVPIFVLKPVVNQRSRASLSATLAPFPGRLASNFKERADRVS
jgi:hypothetical protein